jgi:hypothetical protein
LNYWNYRLRQLSIRQAQNPLRTPGQVRIVGCQHRGQMVIPVQSLQQLNHPLGGSLVKAAGWLIGKQHRRLIG